MSKLRQLLEGLPGGASRVATFMVKFTILQTGTYGTFMQQCLSNTAHLSNSGHHLLWAPEHHHHHHHQQQQQRRRAKRDKVERQRRRDSTAMKNQRTGSERKTSQNSSQRHKSPLAVATTWARLANIHLLAITFIELFILIKFLLVELVTYKLTSKLAYLDCLVLGRFRFVGRSNMISGEISCIFMFVFFIYRWTIYLWRPRFKFYALEFMLYSREEVIQSELRFEQDRRASIVVLPHNDNSTKLAISSSTPPTSSYEQMFLHSPPGGCSNAGFNCGHLPLVNQRNGFGQANSIFYLRSPFEMSSEQTSWILRPNRSETNWDILNLCTKVMFYWSILTIITWIVVMYWALAGSVLTPLGFEISYPACVAWLRDLQFASHDQRRRPPHSNHSHPDNYSHIYLAPKVLAHEMRIDDIPARIPLDTLSFQQMTSLYHILRVIVDLFENHFIYVEFILQFVGQFFILLINSIDVVLNALEINKRLERVLEELEERARLDGRLHEIRADYYAKFLEAHGDDLYPLSSDGDGDGQEGDEVEEQVVMYTLRAPDARSVTSAQWLSHEDAARLTLTDRPHQLRSQLFPGDNHTQASGGNGHGSCVMDDEQLGEEIADLQAILADHFDTLTRGYNLYISFFVTFLLLIWASYTVVVCIWMGAIKSRAIEFEFMIVEIGGTLFTVTFLSSVAIVRAQNVRLYPLIARAMALDPDWSLTKTRWITILSYYSPKSLYCFTIFSSTELSWLLCLKLISWILSAFIVLANFYYMNRF